MPPADLATADRLYQGFPDFAAWGPPAPEDLDLWSRFAASLEERRKTATPEALRKAVDVAVRAAALDTGAIEGLYTVDRGFTMTVAVQGLAWEQMIEERGAGVRELFEAQLEAYELVLDAATRRMPITEAWIRALHEKLCAPQASYRVLTAAGWQEHELPKGRYKTQPNHVKLADGSVHAYAPVDQVASEMHRLVEQIGSPDFEAAHPVLQASYVHYALVAIHPFADGNGRVARALASVYFYRACSIPLLVFANQRLAYFDSLHAADLGDLRPLIAFFRDRGIDVMQLVAEHLPLEETSQPAAIAGRLQKLLNSRARQEALDSLGLRLLRAVEDRIRTEFSSLETPESVALKIQQAQDMKGPLPGYRRIMADPKPIYSVVVENHSAAGARAEAGFRVLIADEESNPFTFLVEGRGYSGNLEIRLADLHPELTPLLDLRLTAWAQRLLGRMLAEVERQSRAFLEKLR